MWTFLGAFHPIASPIPLISTNPHIPWQHSQELPTGEENAGTGNARCGATGWYLWGVNSPARLCPSAEADGEQFLPLVTGPNTGFTCFSRRAIPVAEFALPRTGKTTVQTALFLSASDAPNSVRFPFSDFLYRLLQGRQSRLRAGQRR